MASYLKALKLATKVGLVGGCVYYVTVPRHSSQPDLLGNHDQSVAAYDHLKGIFGSDNQLFQKVSNLFPASKSDDESTASVATNTSKTLGQHWNRGVAATFSSLANLPENVGHYSRKMTSSVTRLISEAITEPSKPPAENSKTDE